jgi:small-conductance mechanosensitive channel
MTISISIPDRKKVSTYRISFITCCFLFSILSSSINLFGQVSSLKQKQDSAMHPIGPQVEDLRTIIKGGADKKRSQFMQDKVIAKQDRLFRQLSLEIGEASELLKKGNDSSATIDELSKINRWFAVASDGVFTNRGTAQTSRNLAITHIIMLESQRRIKDLYKESNTNIDELILQRNVLDSLLADSALIELPEDSKALMNFFNKISEVAKEGGLVYQQMNTAIGEQQDLSLQIKIMLNNLNSRLEEIEISRKNLSNNAMNKEFPYLWDSKSHYRPFQQIVDVSIAKNRIVTGFYFRNHAWMLVLMFLLVGLLAYYLFYLRRTVVNEYADNINPVIHISLKHPVWVSFFVVFNGFQFFFIRPPFLFYAILWTVSAVILTYLFWHKINRNIKRSWLVLVLFSIMVIFNNCILQASRLERWFMLILAAIILISALLILNRSIRKAHINRWIYFFIGIVIFLESISIIANLFGRYTISKTALTSGVLNLLILVLLWWACYFINEIISLTGYLFKLGKYHESEKSSQQERIDSTQFPIYLSIILFVGWFMMFMRNFYAFTLFTEPFWSFLEQDRLIGKYHFTISSIFNFFLIMFVAMLLSRIVSFFASEKHQQENKGKKGIGSLLLLVRIIIFSLGLFFAFAASGIPLDKMAIIFSALSVGIGFGLQTLVNNLVSGLIIAFEKPLNVGDLVDINGQSGMMKSIGFRSSVLSTWDGSDVIIPNGDLLNAHLINWTLSDTKRRADIKIGVAYSADLAHIKSLLEAVLNEDTRVLKYPASSIIFREFGSSSVECSVLFWIDTVKHPWIFIKSDIIQAIDKKFKKEGIEIPFPQQDIYIKTIEGKPVNNQNQKLE